MTTTITPENLAEDRGLLMRQSFLLYPGESSEVDYKTGKSFIKGDNFALTLTKHILGMANAGGGYLVIGYPENAAKHPEAGIVSDEILGTYDLSLIASVVESYTAGTGKVDIKVHKDPHPETSQVYPIIEVGGFKSRPFFCKSSAGGILEENALYIRIASARTVKVATPDEWDQLIDACVTKRQDETLRRFTDLVREIGLPASLTTDDSSKKNLNTWIEEVRADAKEEAKKAGFSFEGLEIIHSVTVDKKWNIKELLEAMQNSALKNTGWAIGFVFHVPEYKPMPYKKGLRSVVAPAHRESFDYWFLNENGDFYFFRAFQEDSYKQPDETVKREVWFDTVIWRVAEGLEHSLSLYKALGVDNTSKITVDVNFFGINDRTLRASPGTGRMLFPRISSGAINQYEWEKNTTLDGLNATLDQSVIEISNGLFVLFDFQELQPNVIQGVIDEYRGSGKR